MLETVWSGWGILIVTLNGIDGCICHFNSTCQRGRITTVLLFRCLGSISPINTAISTCKCVCQPWHKSSAHTSKWCLFLTTLFKFSSNLDNFDTCCIPKTHFPCTTSRPKCASYAEWRSSSAWSRQSPKGLCNCQGAVRCLSLCAVQVT